MLYLSSLMLSFYSLFFTKKINIELERNDGDYFSTSKDDHFIFDQQTLNLPANHWYLIKLKLSIKGKRQAISRFYFDYGKGFNTNAIEVPLTSGVAKSTILFTKQQAVRIKFEPLDSKGGFKVDSLQFIPIHPFFAEKYMLNALLHSKEDITTSKIKNKIDTDSALKKRFLEKLLKQYQAIDNSPNSPSEYRSLIPTFENRWFSQYKIPNKYIAQLTTKHLISIILPIHNPNTDFIEDTLQSVLAQSYPHWELCITCHSVHEKSLKKHLSLSKLIEPQFKLLSLNESDLTLEESAISLATGEFVTFLKQDDLLAQHALLSIVTEINNSPKSKLIYSDSDEIDENNERLNPHFKSGWNPDLLYSYNYISNLVVYHSELIRSTHKLFGQDSNLAYDLLLHTATQINPKYIRHIPKILYHQRLTHNNKENENKTNLALLTSLKGHLKKISDHVTVTQEADSKFCRVQYPIPENKPLVSLLIPTRDHVDLLVICINSILEKTTYSDYEILILDNDSQEQSTLDYFENISKNPIIKVLHYKQPFNFSAINNYGASHAKGEIIGFINNDIEVISPDWMNEMVSHVCREEIGCVGAKLLYDNDTIQHAGVILGLGGVAGHSHKHFERFDDGYCGRLKGTQSLSAVTAACLFMQKKLFEEVNGYDEGLAVAFNDVDLCLKVNKLGYRNIWTPFAELYHHESISRGRITSSKKRKQFANEKKHMISKWKDSLTLDHYYNPNLTTSSEDFSIKKT